ncbi:PCC domain-containing protein [Piscinibacter sp.]|uniref:PCC domain-containing protein n=1 Tax=Piscinibacter sp. TaxID=1903157 RepID=UPI0039E68731
MTATARRLQQPGPPAALRINARHAAQARHVRLHLPAGASLFDALVQPLARIGIRHASVTLLGGWLERAQYCVSVPDPAGQALLTHGAPLSTGRVGLVTANATLATGVDGRPLVHCHAVLQAPDAPLVGGHLLTPHCLVAAPGLVARVAGFEGFELRAAFDPETRLPLVQPA